METNASHVSNPLTWPVFPETQPMQSDDPGDSRTTGNEWWFSPGPGLGGAWTGADPAAHQSLGPAQPPRVPTGGWTGTEINETEKRTQRWGHMNCTLHKVTKVKQRRDSVFNNWAFIGKNKLTLT